MRPIRIVSVLFVLGCGVVLYTWQRDEPQILEEQPSQKTNAGSASVPTLNAVDAMSFDEVGDAETESQQADELPITLAPFEAGGTLLTEPYDADWAAGAEAIIEATLRTVDARVRDVRHVVCRTHSCRAVVMHDIAMWHLPEPQRTDEHNAITPAIERAMEPVLQGDLRLKHVRVLPMRVLVSRSEVDISRLDEMAGSIVRFSGSVD